MCSLLLLLVLVSTSGVFSFFNDGQQPKAEQAAVQSPTPSPTPSRIESDPKAWKEYFNETGRFRVMLPGNPVEEDNSSGALRGRKFIVVTTAYYLVAYQDIPTETAPEFEKPEMRKLLFEGIRDATLGGIAKRAKVDLVEDVEVAINGHPGRFQKFKTEDGHVARQNAYLVKNRIYQVMVVTSKELLAPDGGKFDEMRATKFLKSFTPTEESEPRPPEMKQ